jgi:NAD(P)-dependent dehydrogenase (short-subunit alcohol dehydrogenase family)
LAIFEVNLQGTFYVMQVALAAMKQNRTKGSGDDKSITLLSSVAGFKDSPGLFAYTATKHGVLGLMRSLRAYLPVTFNIRVNVVCPWATDTQMFEGVRPAWQAANLPLNTPDQVARVILEAAGSPNLQGSAFYVSGGEAVDIDEGINRLEPEWLGTSRSKDLARGQEILGLVSHLGPF